MEENPENDFQENMLKSEILGKVLFPGSVIQKRVSELGNINNE